MLIGPSSSSYQRYESGNQRSYACPEQTASEKPNNECDYCCEDKQQDRGNEYYYHDADDQQQKKQEYSVKVGYVKGQGYYRRQKSINREFTSQLLLRKS